MKILNKIDWLLTDCLPNLFFGTAFLVFLGMTGAAVYEIYKVINSAYLKMPIVTIVGFGVGVSIFLIVIYWNERNLNWYNGYKP